MSSNPDSTTHNQWQKLKRVFNEVTELAPETRLSYLSNLKLTDEAIYTEVLSLLEAEPKAEEFLRDPFVKESLEFDHEPSYDFLPEGKSLGRYKIIREIACGGMGNVYEAERSDDEFNQRFAVKLINPFFAGADLINKFKREQQILATLKHPGIVRLLDGGLLNNRIPYCVMEYVEGVQIDIYCRENAFSLHQKLELFLQVADAVAYAHRQLVVHRDLKPSNILVNGEGQVKLLDFGIAKILDKNSSIQTRTQNSPLTPAYASPEQIKGETITTASDIFSLGTVLCELLTEKPPHEFYNAEDIDMPRVVCDVPPVRPSSLLRQSVDQNSPDEPDFRRLSFSQNLLRGDLDTIVLKALNKEPENRYSSVEKFAEDIRFYLQGLPIKAHPPSLNYRFSKFIRRNKWQTVLAASAVLAITGGIFLAVWQSFNAREQQQIAERQRQVADQRFAQARQAANLIIFDYHDRLAELPGSVTLREKMVSDALNYLNALSKEEIDNPELLREMAAAYRKIGDVQGESYAANLGKHAEALQNYDKSVVLLEKVTATAPSDLKAQNELVIAYRALAYAQMRSGDKPKGQQTLNKAIDLQKDLVQKSPADFAGKMLLLKLKGEIGDTNPIEDVKTSLKIYQDVLREAEVLFAENPDDAENNRLMARFTQRVGTAFRWAGERDERSGGSADIQEYYRQAVENIYRTYNYHNRFIELGGSGNPRSAITIHIELAQCLLHTGQIKEGLNNIKAAEKLFQKVKKEDPNNRENNLDELNFYNFKMKFFLLEKQPDQALKIIREASVKAQKASEADPTNTEAMSWVGYFSKQAKNILIKQNKSAESAIYEKLFGVYARKFKDQSGNDWSGEFGF